MRVIHSELMATINTGSEKIGHLADGASPHTTMRCPLDTPQVTFIAGLN